MTSFLEQLHELKGCHRNRVQELAEQCDHEYFMNVLPNVGNKERAMRGYLRISNAMEEFKQLLEVAECKSCRDKITNQLSLQRESLQEIEAAWNIIEND